MDVTCENAHKRTLIEILATTNHKPDLCIQCLVAKILYMENKIIKDDPDEFMR